MPKSARRVVQTSLYCSECGNKASIFRRKNRRKSFGHIKDLWCYKCKKVTKHIEAPDDDFVSYKDINSGM